MMKPLIIAPLVIVALFLSGCASSPIEKQLENNFVYQCSIQLFDKIDKKITGEDAEKICTAAYQEQVRKNAQPLLPSAAATPTPTPSVTTASPSPSPSLHEPATEKASVETDEVKPEPTPKK